jgi:DNA-binding MarR family transcriptional regulator
MPTSSTKISDYAAARCLELTTVFQDQLLEEPLPASAPGTVRRRQLALLTTAQAACRSCPLIIDCLYRAVVEYDVAGYVAGTTPPQPAQIRRQLDITVKPEDFDSLAAVTRHHRQLNHSELVRLRNANPNDSLETLARRLGCSLSTVKRHLRRERRQPAARIAPPRPSVAEVVAVAAVVTGSPPARRGRQAA